MVALDPDIEPAHTFPDLDSFLSATTKPIGHVRIATVPVPVDFRYIERGSNNLAIFFTAAVPKDSAAPRFTGFGISRELNANGLHFADPSVALTPEIFLAWYTGSRELPFQQIMLDIIGKYSPSGTEGNQVLYGGSAGGFTSLYAGFHMPGSTAIAANPQTDLRRYNPALIRRWLDVCWGLGEDIPSDVDQVEATTDLVTLYKGGCPNKVVLLQNAQDESHVGPHFEPFIKASQLNSKVRYKTGDWGIGHKAPPKEVIVESLNLAVAEDWASEKWINAGYRRASDYQT